MSGIFFWKADSTSGTTTTEEYRQTLRNALTEINLPKDNNAAIISASSDNLANFIYYRSGIQLSQANKNLLVDNEQKSWAQSKKITQTQLAQILTEVAFDKLVTLSDSDLAGMAETLRGFNTAAYSSAYPNAREFVRLRANGEGIMEPAYFVSEVKAVRDAEIAKRNRPYSSPDLGLRMSRAALHERISSEIAERVAELKDADTTFSDTTPSDLTPAEAMLLTYSIVTNDFLMGNQSELQQLMAGKQQLVANYGGQFPSPQGYNAYGVNGYIYSSPADLLLDDATTAQVLNLIKIRSDLQ
jgi:hypothetical protein